MAAPAAAAAAACDAFAVVALDEFVESAEVEEVDVDPGAGRTADGDRAC